MFIDIHAHLQDEKLIDNVEKVICDALNSGVQKIICAGYDIMSSRQAVDLANKYPCVFAAVGIHPENVNEYNEQTEKELCCLAQNKKVVAIGEIGLDYHFVSDNKEKQKQVFLSQIKLANKLNLPIVIHTRDAIKDTLDILKENKTNKAGVFHCFSGSKETLNEVIKLGYNVSFGGAITFNNATNLRDIVLACPVDKLLTETDCPYMTPVPFRGQVNEPKFVLLVIEKMCEIKNIQKNELEKIIENNVKNIFNI